MITKVGNDYADSIREASRTMADQIRTRMDRDKEAIRAMGNRALNEAKKW